MGGSTFSRMSVCKVFNLSNCLLKTSVPDPKLIISDPDPQIQNQEFRIRILDPDPSVSRDGEKKLSISVIMKTQEG